MEITQHETGGQIIFDKGDFLSGLNPQYTTSVGGSERLTGLSAASEFNPYRFLGYACPGSEPTDATGVAIATSYLKNGFSSGAYGYFIGGALIHKYTLLTNTFVNDTAGKGFPRTITGTSPTVEDIIEYNIGTTTYGFTTLNNSTVGDLCRFTLDGSPSVFIDDYLTNASYLNYAGWNKDVPHPVVIGTDDIMYVGNGNVLDGIDGQDGANGTHFAGALTLPKGYVISSFAKLKDTLVIYAYKATSASGGSFYLSESTAFFWDYLSLDPTSVVDLNDNYVRGGFEYNGTVGCFTSGRRGDISSLREARLKLWNGTVFETVSEYIRYTPSNGGVEIKGNMIQWAASNGTNIEIFSYGSPFKGMPNVLNKIARGTGNSPGMLKSFTPQSQLVSTGVTTSGGLDVLSASTYSDSAIMSTELAEPAFSVGRMGRAKFVKVIFKGNTTGGRGLSVSLYDRYASQTEFIANLEAITATNRIKEYEVTKEFEALSLSLVWSAGSGATTAPIVAKVIVDFENINI